MTTGEPDTPGLIRHAARVDDPVLTRGTALTAHRE